MNEYTSYMYVIYIMTYYNFVLMRNSHKLLNPFKMSSELTRAGVYENSVIPKLFPMVLNIKQHWSSPRYTQIGLIGQL